MKIFMFNGKRLKVIREINDEKYGRIWDAYYEHRKVYICEGKVIEEQEIMNAFARGDSIKTTILP